MRASEKQVVLHVLLATSGGNQLKDFVEELDPADSKRKAASDSSWMSTKYGMESMMRTFLRRKFSNSVRTAIGIKPQAKRPRNSIWLSSASRASHLQRRASRTGARPYVTNISEYSRLCAGKEYMGPSQGGAGRSEIQTAYRSIMTEKDWTTPASLTLRNTSNLSTSKSPLHYFEISKSNQILSAEAATNKGVNCFHITQINTRYECKIELRCCGEQGHIWKSHHSYEIVKKFSILEKDHGIFY